MAAVTTLTLEELQATAPRRLTADMQEGPAKVSIWAADGDRTFFVLVSCASIAGAETPFAISAGSRIDRLALRPLVSGAISERFYAYIRATLKRSATLDEIMGLPGETWWVLHALDLAYEQLGIFSFNELAP